MKIFFRRIHLYLSLAAGVVIFTACLTGAILVFEQDLQMAMNKKQYYVEADAYKLSLEQIVKKVKDSFPDAKINGVKVYEDVTRSAEVSVAFPSKKGAATEAPKAKEEKKHLRNGSRDLPFLLIPTPDRF